MDITALVSIAVGRDAALPSGAPLAAGERLPVRVLEVRDDGKVLVDCGRFRAVAEVTFPVSAGDEFTVRVIEGQGALRLEVVRPSSPGAVVPADARATEAAPILPAPLLRDVQIQAGRLLAVLPPTATPEDPGSLQSAAARVTELLRPLEPGHGTDVPERIRDLCRNSGLFLESRIQDELIRDSAEAAAGRPANTAAVRRILAADLKAQLSALVHELQAGAPATTAARESAEMLRSARGLLTEIVQQQAAITRTTDESRQMTLIHFSLPLDTPQGAARLKVGFPRRRKRRGRSGGHRAALLVDLDRLGPVRADLQLNDGVLTADLFVRSAEYKAAVEEHASELRSGLAPLFEAVHVAVRVSEKKIVDFEWEDLRPPPGRAFGRARMSTRRPDERRKAAALRYDPKRDSAPKVVARGSGHVAERIEALAREHHVPLHEDPNLVEVLEAMDVDTEIPPALYRAVAEVLAFVYRLNGKLKT